MQISAHKQRIARVFDEVAKKGDIWLSRSRTYHQYVTKLVSRLAPDPGRVLELGSGSGDLLASLPAKKALGIDISNGMVDLARKRHPDLEFRHGDAENLDLKETFDTVVMVNLIGQLENVYECFKVTRKLIDNRGQVIVVYYNHLWELALRVASTLKLRAPIPYENWLPLSEVEHLLALTGFQVVRGGRRMLCPKYIPLISWFLNTCVAQLPLFQTLCLIEYVVARPISDAVHSRADELSCSIIIPTKDERGNIQAAMDRTPKMGKHTELIFVDGNSKDGTVAEIERLIKEYPDRDIKLILQGDGRGKADAVRKGFAVATGDVLMILDSDLTMPPEDLPRFYEILASGQAEFVNGCRLVYPMEKDAMRLLNKIANHIFGRLFSWLLEQRVRDTLCGTKVLFRDDYLKIAANRKYFGEFDPFGDFDLLFGAARLNLKIVDFPIRYKERTYGEIKIDRFRHGLLLIRMFLFGMGKLK